MIKFYGNTLKGLKHIESKMPNQDSYHLFNSKYVSCAIVSDGLGSKSHSHYGSKKLAHIGVKLLRNLDKKEPDIGGFLEKMSEIWLAKTTKYGSKNCDATCLFALVNQDYCFLGQIGDGMIAATVDEKLLIVKNKDDDFLNETSSFYNAKINDWNIKRIDLNTHNMENILMTTDGISNDLIDDSIQEFIKEMANSLKTYQRKKKNVYIAKVLKNMPNKNNVDDKTIVIGRQHGK